jgi:hypothetical protein
MTDNNAQRRSNSYRLPVEDTELLLRDEMRAVRFALEYAKAELSLRDWGVRSTIIVFGSAQIPSPEQAQSLLHAAEGTPVFEESEAACPANAVVRTGARACPAGLRTRRCAIARRPAA